MRLGVHTGENRRVGYNGQGGLRVSALKNDTLPGESIKIWSDFARCTEKTHSVGSRRIQSDEHDVWLGRGERNRRENTQEQETNDLPQHGKQSNTSDVLSKICSFNAPCQGELVTCPSLDIIT